MTDRPQDAPPALSLEVRSALVESQRLGFLGERPIDEVVDHARAFVAALVNVRGRVVDMGSGGGVPGLIVAHDRPDLSVTMVDRRMKRTDFLERIVHRLGWAQRVMVIHADLADLIRREGRSFDAAIARGFGPPADTLTLGAQLIVDGGSVIISEPPQGDRWDVELLHSLHLRRVDEVDRRVARFRSASPPS